MEACSGQAFVHRFSEAAAEAQDLTRRFHFRAKDGVCIRELLEGEHRDLHGEIGRLLVQARAVAHIAELFTQHAAHGQVHHGHARNLAYIGHGTAGPGIYLYAVHLVIRHGDELDVYHTLYMKGFGKTSCILSYLNNKNIKINNQIFINENEKNKIFKELLSQELLL